MLLKSSAEIVGKTDVQNIMICICKHGNKTFPHIPKLQAPKYLKTKNVKKGYIIYRTVPHFDSSESWNLPIPP